MTTPLTVVIDTSVWVSGVFFRGNPFRVLQAWRDEQFELVYTPETLAEIEARLHDKAKEFGANPADVDAWMTYIRTFARLTSATGAAAGVTRDPQDDKFLDAAVSGGATYLVSSDHDLQVLEKYCGVQILSPGQFLAVIERLAS